MMARAVPMSASPASPSASWSWPNVWQGERGGWWRVPVTLAFCAAGVLLGILLFTGINLHGLKTALAEQPPCIQSLASLGGTILITGLGLAGCLAGVRFVHRKPVACVFTDGRAFGWRLAFRSAGLWALLWLAFTLPLPGAGAGMVARIEEVPAIWWPAVLLATLAAMTVGRTAEEVIFRGYLQTRVAAWAGRPWLAVIVVAAGFSLLHGGNAAAHTAIVLFGLAWGAACVRAGTLAPMIGAHVAHDTMNVLLLPSTHVTSANDHATWTEVGLIAAALGLWFVWLMRATRGPRSA